MAKPMTLEELCYENEVLKAKIENAKLTAEFEGLQPKKVDPAPYGYTTMLCGRSADYWFEQEQLAQDRLEFLKATTVKLEKAHKELEAVHKWLGKTRYDTKPMCGPDSRQAGDVWDHLSVVLKEIA